MITFYFNLLRNELHITSVEIKLSRIRFPTDFCSVDNFIRFNYDIINNSKRPKSAMNIIFIGCASDEINHGFYQHQLYWVVSLD